MFFTLSKILFLFAQPSSVLLLASLVGLLLSANRRWAVIGRRLAVIGVMGVGLGGFLPVGNALLFPLEERFGGRVAAEPPAGAFAGIIMLGGFEDGWVSSGRGGLGLNEAAERLIEGVRLARRLPEAKVVFTGGVGNLFWGIDMGKPVRDHLLDAGIAPDRIVIENHSRNTWENGIYTRDLVRPKPGERWLLVTSAFHMPRAIGVFRRVGFDVVPFPVDFRTRDAGDLRRPLESMPRGLERLDLAAKEWIGLVAYRLSDMTSALFPAP